jgi:hypothetical protein
LIGLPRPLFSRHAGSLSSFSTRFCQLFSTSPS